MAKKGRVRIVEYDRNQLVVDIDAGRLVIEPDSVRFHKNGRGRGVALVGKQGRLISTANDPA
jgi:hypothetical protein